MRLVLVLLTALLIACLPSCRSFDEDTPSTVVTPHVFVGRAEANQALVAIVEGEDSVVAYSCGIGASFTTHTGWYLGARFPEAGGAIEAVNGPAGLRLKANLGASGGSGTITLADGKEVRFDVEPARGNAGLYDYEDAGQFVGFIRANDGSTAGNARISIDSSPSTTTTISTSTTVAVSTTQPPTTTTTTTTPPPTGPTVVTFDVNNASRLVTVTLTTTDKRIVKRTGPVVIFMMHGMADNLGTPAAGSADNVRECSGPKDSPFYGRCEWGPDVLSGLFGTSNVNAQLTTLDGRDVTGERFISDVANRPPERDARFDENLGKPMAGDCVSDPNVQEQFDARIAQHFVVPGAVRTPITTAPNPLSTSLPPAPPRIAAFVTWRDGTRGMVFSGRRITRQIYAALRWYEAVYRVTPGVILLAQSFGGLASRFMLSKPDPALLDADTNRERVTLCKEDLAKMDYIRDRVLYLTTLATPHEGSYLAEWGPPVKDALKALLAELRAGLSSSVLSRVLRAMDQTATLLGLNSTPSILNGAIASIDGFVPQLESAAALVDMQLARMEKFNRGPIAPDRARRTAGSPILGAQRTLVPIYVTLSRSPGSNAFDSPDILKGFATYQKKRPKAQGWIGQTMLISDQLTRQLLPKGFGDATVAPYTNFRSILDRRARLFDSSPTTTQLEQKFSADIANILRIASPWLLGKFGRNADAVIAALNRELTIALPHVAVPIHIDQKWKIGFQGTIDVPMPAFRCQTAQFPLDLDALARLLVNTYSRTPDVLAVIQGKDIRAILELLAVTIQNTDQFATQTARWFVDKVAEAKQLLGGNLPADCDFAPTNPFDVFALAKMKNWSIVATTGQIPAPAFIPTGEAVFDGEMDTDGAVHSASALGFTLGREPFFFEHNRNDDAGKIGSWYRIYDNPVTEKYNHGQQYENDVGLWINNTFFVPQVGPVPAQNTFSVWIE